MYYQRLLYRQFTNHFISGICDIYNLSVGTNSYTERMIEQRDIRTAVFIAFMPGSPIGVVTIALSKGNLVSITRIQLLPQSAIYNLPSSVKHDLMGIIKLGIPQQTVFPSCSCYLSFQYAFPA